ncbi:receptor-like protein EIX1 [Lactuca sativa]|uniref:receptor-like protein EIX1 n=1 Tax=Lactuca sativa TaxID=4236 RepID=UPI0022AEFCAE|nr:receptor-like protein EIX1 [Lactuca sativa]
MVRQSSYQEGTKNKESNTKRVTPEPFEDLWTACKMNIDGFPGEDEAVVLIDLKVVMNVQVQCLGSICIHPVDMKMWRRATYTCLGLGNVSVICSEHERLALLNFKHSIQDPFEMLSSWVGNECCMWEGIQCDAVTGNVQRLKLNADSYYDFFTRNKVSSSLAELRHLKYLDLSGNGFFLGSQIPEFIGSFKQLTYLNLFDAGFEGIIPPQIGNLSNLKVLNLGSNFLKADEIAWISRLPSLELLDLSSVDLSGAQNWDQTLLHMTPLLKELSLSNCLLSNVELGAFLNLSRILPNIKHLDLGFNSFEGPLPTFFQNMTSLTFLDLSVFNLSLAWNFPDLLSMIPSLSELHLFDCGLDRTHLSSPRLNFSTLSNIQHLDLSFNPLGGIFLSFLTNMSSLRVLDLSDTMLNSSLPIMPKLLELHLSYNMFKQIEHVGIWRQCHLQQLRNAPNSLANLRVLDLSYNRLVGSIPESLSRLRFLEVLDLSQNHLTGPVPEFPGNLTKLDLSSNQLTGSIPKSLGKLVALTDLNLSSNLLNGSIPLSIGKFAKLRSLVLSNNSLEGVVTEAYFANLSMLKDLDASSNTKLTFNVSRGWIPPFQLKSLNLSSCNISNGFPQWLRKQRKLQILVLSNATLSGPLPTWLRKMPIIPVLDLSHNKFSGPLTNLPNGGNDKVYTYSPEPALLLEYNLFNGSIPRSLCRRTYLVGLDLSKNMLSGKIPNCLGNLKDLTNMILSSNRLSGVIPSSISLNSSLFWLSLNDNNFIGELPRELANLQRLQVLDVGDNKFSGNIPKWIGEKLIDLVVLRLHKNNFTGRIPRSLCKISSLQILDLAYNNLTGTIPRCVGKLNGMVESYSIPLYHSASDYDKNVIQGMKGVDLEYTTIWGMWGDSTQHWKDDRVIFSSSMAALHFLSHLNLSYNNLSGQIPTGNQLQTLNDPSIYAGNKHLCGPPLPNTCSNHQDPTTTRSKKKHKATDEWMKVWLFYGDIMSGFVTGFWGVIGVVLFKKQWRQKLFMFAEVMVDKIYVAVMLRVSKIKRGREAA